jgi:hypothetical protein
MIANSPGHVDGNAKILMALKNSVQWKSPRSPGRMLNGAWCAVARPVGDLSRPYDTLTCAPQELGFEREKKDEAKGIVTIAEIRSTWGRKVQTWLELPQTHSLNTPQTLNTNIDKVARP